MFSNIICIGDSYTNEIEHYKNADIDFEKLGYEFKSYPQLLGEHYGCEWETFGRPGMPMPYTLQILIDKIDYIQSLENPLVIYQFGFFDNLILSMSSGKYFEWKDIVLEEDGFGPPSGNNSNILKGSMHTNISINHNFFENMKMDKLEAVGMLSFLEKFGALSNYHLIEQFLSISKLVKRTSNAKIYGIFLAGNSKITVPNHNDILFMGENGWGLDNKETLDMIYPQFGDTHKTTKANQEICDEIVDILLKKLNIDGWREKYGNNCDGLI